MTPRPHADAARRIRRLALGDFVHRSARRFAGRTAVVDGDLRLSYAELDARSSRFAHYLLQALGSGRQVATLCQNSADLVAAYTGIHKSGNVWVPVNIRLDVPAIEYTLQHAEVAAVVVDADLHADPALAAVLQGLGVPLILSLAMAGDEADTPGAIALASAEAGRSDALPDIDIDDQQPALLMYTSGTTGLPKGVLHSHLSVASALLGNASGFAYHETDVFSGVLPLFHCAQHALVATAHAVGACVVLSRAFVPHETRAQMLAERMTVFIGLPLMYAALLADPQFRSDSLRLCLYALAPMPRPLVAQIAQRLSDNVLLAAGQTEIYPATMVFKVLAHPQLDANYWGTALMHCDTAVMDEEGRLLGPGEAGEIVHRGPNVMLGYFKDEQASAQAQRFGWHHTGDLGLWGPDGQLLFIDRKRDLIKTGGESVASIKVEAALLAHPGVAGAAVLGLPHPRWSEAVSAFVVKKPGADDLQETALLAHCRERLSGFELPRLVRFVDALPMTATGKVKKHVLRQQCAHVAQQAWRAWQEQEQELLGEAR